jgi:hypothetical protein
LDGRTALEFTGPESLVHGHPLSGYSGLLRMSNYSNERRVEKLSRIVRTQGKIFLYLDVVDVVLKNVM